MIKKYPPEMMPEVKEMEDGSIQISIPFLITWKNQEYYGTFTVTSTQKTQIDSYEIKWLSKTPDFGELKNRIYENLEEKLLEEVSRRYNI